MVFFGVGILGAIIGASVSDPAGSSTPSPSAVATPVPAAITKPPKAKTAAQIAADAIATRKPDKAPDLDDAVEARKDCNATSKK